MSTDRDKSTASGSPTDGDPARLAHELANLLDGSLRNIGLAIRTLRDESASPPDTPVLRRLDTANDGLHQMAALIKGWLSPQAADDWARGDRVTIGRAIELTLAMLGPRAQAAGATIHVDTDGGCESLPAGPLLRVFDNLVRNSLDALSTDAGHDAPAVVNLCIAQRDRHLDIRVTDTGPGFDPALFDEDDTFRFGRTTKADGHGIGLTLCADIIHRLGGAIVLSNQSQGGASVRCVLPLARLTQEEAAADLPPGQPSSDSPAATDPAGEPTP